MTRLAVTRNDAVAIHFPHNPESAFHFLGSVVSARKMSRIQGYLVWQKSMGPTTAPNCRCNLPPPPAFQPAVQYDKLIADHALPTHP